MTTSLTRAIDGAIEELEEDGREPTPNEIALLALNTMSASTKDEAAEVGAVFRARYRLRARKAREPGLEDRMKEFLSENPDATPEEIAEFVKSNVS